MLLTVFYITNFLFKFGIDPPCICPYNDCTGYEIMYNSKKYIKHQLGADGAESVYHAIKHAKLGIDGIIHIKSYSCVPEINAMPILSQISEDYQVPILYLSYEAKIHLKIIAECEF